MKKSIFAFFKGFSYAAKGFAYCVKHERNMRFHICAAVTVMIFSRFYEFSRTEYALLAVIFASVMSAEAFNTAVERAVDLTCGNEKNDLAGTVKDCAAGAVLISAFFAAAAGIALFLDTAVFGTIFEFFTDRPMYAVLLLVYAAVCFIFVFGTDKIKK